MDDVPQVFAAVRRAGGEDRDPMEDKTMEPLKLP